MGAGSDAITDVPGIEVGHYSDLEAATGCTVILCPKGAVGGVEVAGAAPGTRETDILRPMHLVQKLHALLLSGGSAFGLQAAGGVVRFLEEKGIGFDVGVARVPIVPAAILFDLFIGNPRVRPGAEEGYQACLAASSHPPAQGSVGAGTGATVGKALGPQNATKGGIGTASERLGGLVVGALAAVNAYGEVVHPETGRLLAGPRDLEKGGFFRTIDLMRQGKVKRPSFPVNTTLGVVATNAVLTKEEANSLARMARAGLSRCIYPTSTMLDGDVLFALALGEEKGDLNTLGAVAAEVVARAIVRAITSARGVAGIPSAGEWSR